MSESPKAPCEILVGTSGYGYLEWVGPVYAAGSRPDDLLTQYASMLPTVELNFSYYKMPTAEQLARLMAQAGPDLVFSIKANEELTHKIDPSAWKDAARAFMEALEPLRKAERLGAVLFQFPYSFHYEVDHRRYLDAVLAQFAALPLAVEFRNHEWYNNRVLDALRDRRVAIASLDLPALRGLPPVMDVVTSPLAYIRFHGRNGESWWGSDSASRYDYLYTDDELEAWAGRVRAIAEKAERILVYFNNHRRGQAVQNARSFAGILDRAGIPGRAEPLGRAGPRDGSRGDRS
jgi:uncharacterized protein YecE (DUF72 family)